MAPPSQLLPQIKLVLKGLSPLRPRGLEIRSLIFRPLIVRKSRGRRGRFGSFERVGEKEVEEGNSETSSTDDVDEIMMREIHRGPIQNARVSPNEPSRLRKKVGDEEGIKSGAACVQ